MVLVGDPKRLETSKKMTSLGGCLNLPCSAVWGHWGGAAHGLSHTVVLCTGHLPTAGGWLWSGMAVLAGASCRASEETQ